MIILLRATDRKYRESVERWKISLFVFFSDSWKRWKQELEFNMDLAMNGREEATKVKLFLYLIGSQGREIYDTMAFEVPASERTLTQV